MIVGAAILTGCATSPPAPAAGGAGSVGDNDWTLEGMSPDEQHLVVSTLFGGVASGCTRFEEWEVDESTDSVEIRARLWRQSAPTECTEEGVVEVLQVDLDRPLGDRVLVGCGVEDCRSTVAEGGNLVVGQVIAAGDLVAVVEYSGIDVYASSGEPPTEIAGATSGQALRLGDGVVVRNDLEGSAVAVDLSSGAEIWRAAGSAVAADAGSVYVCRFADNGADESDDFIVLAALDAETGEDRWQSDVTCESIVVHDDLVTVVGHDPDIDGGHRVTVLDTATGSVVAERELFDGIDDRVTDLDSAIAVGSNTITSGPQANLIVLAPDGTEIARSAEVLGTPLGEADEVAVVGSYDQLAAYGIAEESALWTLDIDAFGSVSVGDGSVWMLDRAGGAVSRLDARTGDALWTTSIGATTSFDVAGNGDTAYILTTQALIAVDNETGTIRWSQHRSFEGAD